MFGQECLDSSIPKVSQDTRHSRKKQVAFVEEESESEYECDQSESGSDDGDESEDGATFTQQDSEDDDPIWTPNIPGQFSTPKKQRIAMAPAGSASGLANASAIPYWKLENGSRTPPAPTCPPHLRAVTRLYGVLGVRWVASHRCHNRAVSTQTTCARSPRGSTVSAKTAAAATHATADPTPVPAPTDPPAS
ncbi:hypothetical protein MAPG_11306 [Magnaporthiopsis poae ATCC 64411]|uniref:Uncharacterized protein n=1 Tax=Magnaporthiopsis poae (strain ATCC 64411 / 73-15) TaxID=644358 RepID=A0A0C4EEX4_MAGP6|nr:hypothetical protein MAPG_11306 [Magnaporthiopsis poae ATCC 64411]